MLTDELRLAPSPEILICNIWLPIWYPNVDWSQSWNIVRIYPSILTDFNYATLASLYIFQITVVCKIPLLRWCHPKLASSANNLVLIVQLNWTTLFAPYEFSHLNISLVEEILSYWLKGYTQINFIYANKLYRRPVNQYESDFSMTNKVHITNLLLLVFLDLKKQGIIFS